MRYQRKVSQKLKAQLSAQNDFLAEHDEVRGGDRVLPYALPLHSTNCLSKLVEAL
jgi:hypothetical protein